MATSSSEREPAVRRRPQVRRVGLLALVVVAVVPAALGLWWAVTVHPLLVLPAYLVGLPLYAIMLSLLLSGVRRLRGPVRRPHPSQARSQAPGRVPVRTSTP